MLRDQRSAGAAAYCVLGAVSVFFSHRLFFVSLMLFDTPPVYVVNTVFSFCFTIIESVFFLPFEWRTTERLLFAMAMSNNSFINWGEVHMKNTRTPKLIRRSAVVAGRCGPMVAGKENEFIMH